MNLLSPPSSGNRHDEKRALLEERLRRAAESSESIPVSFAQQRLWVIDQLEPNSPLYNMPVVVRLLGTLNVSAYKRAFAALVERHEILRTRFVCHNETPVQMVEPDAAPEITEHDLTRLANGERDAEAWRLVHQEVNRPFDLRKCPLIRATLIRLATEEHWLVLNMHHIVSDEWSLKICFRDLSALYEAFSRNEVPHLPDLPIQYADYTLWQRQSLESEILEKQLAFWRQQLQDNPPVLELTSDRSRTAVPTFRGGNCSRPLAADLPRALKDLASRHGASLFMVLLAAFKTLLHRYTRQDDILIGSPISGRNRVETEDLIGFFVNTLMLRTHLGGDPSFEELLRRIRETTLGAYANQDLPFERIVEELRPERTLNHMPFARIMFVLQNSELEDLTWPGLKLHFLDVPTDTAKFDLTLVVHETRRGFVAQAEFNRDLFDDDTIARLLEHFEVLLMGIAAEPARRLSELPLLSDAERRQVTVEWNNTHSEFPRDACIHQLFEAQAEKTPGAVAIVFGKTSMTWRELNSHANQLARHLKRFSVRPGVPVGLCTERSVEMIVGMLAILKAGGIYVPLDPSYPKSRLAFMLNDSQAPVLLTQQKLLNQLPRTTARVICLDSDWDLIGRENKTNLSKYASPEKLAYLLYTSGSTGQPKGVAVPHRAVVRLVLDTNYIDLTAPDRMAQISNISFDAATFEIWGALLNGAQLIGISKDVALDPKAFTEELHRQRITVLFLTTALFHHLAAEVPAALSGFRAVLFGGDAVDPKWVRAVLKNPPQRLINGYGPTENTTFSACYEVHSLPDEATTVPIGRPISNTQCYILDPHLNPMPIGVPGELCVSGAGLAQGYWNRPELNGQRFVPNPFATDNESRLLYKTGDLVRWRSDGNIEFLGRLDHQVKIRGFRIELGEIESVLSRHPGVRECVATVRTDPMGDRKLTAYYVPHGRRGPSISELRNFLKERFPEYQVPSTFVQLAAMPLTPNGKVDRQSLPEPGRERPDLEKRYATPQDAVEVELTRIWQDALGIHPIGIEDKFFELGGHSLLAVRVIAQIEKTFGRKLKLATIFQAQTIEQLAAIIRKEIHEDSAISGTSLVEIQPKGSRTPLFFVHGAGGGMFWGYVNLSRYLGPDQPVYGLRSRGLDGQEEFQSIGEMAAHYVSDIRAVQPQGPYRLGGYCFGGNVAYEMARQLREQGEQVEVLALFNCSAPNSRYSRIGWSPRWAFRFLMNLRYWMRYFFSWTRPQRREFFRWKKEMLRRRTHRMWKRSPASQASIDAGDMVDLSSYTVEQRKLWEDHIRALMNFHPQSYDGPLHLFRSPGHPMLCSFDADYGWGDKVGGGVEITIVPGVHEKILEEPCVEALGKELNALLDTLPAKSAPAERPTTYRSSMSEPTLDDRVQYWKAELKGASELLELPADRARPATSPNDNSREAVLLSAQISQALEELSKARSHPLSVTLLAAFNVALARYTGVSDLVVGVLPRATKTANDGCGRKLVPIRASWPADPTFGELTKQLNEKLAQAAKHDLALEKYLTEIGVTPNTSYAPVFQVAFALEDKPAAAEEPRLIGLNGTTLDLALRLARTSEGLTGWFEFNPALFDAARISRLIEHFGTLLQSAVTNPDQPISTLPLLPDDESRRMLVDWNATEKEFHSEMNLAQMFEAQVERTPDATALIAGAERITYRDLNTRANQLAHYLRSMGVGPESLVGVCLERSSRLLVAILGVLKAGGAYVPLDPVYPKDRLAFILEDTQAPVLITQKSLSSIAPAKTTRVIRLDSDEDQDRMAAQCRENPFSGAEPANLAYVIYTSGSTGRPKGVALEHRNAVALICWARDVFSAKELSGVLASTSVCFDLSVFEMFVPLSWGGTVILAENALALLTLPARDQVTLINTVPSAISELIRIKGVPPSVTVVNLAGEPLATSLVNRIYSATNAKKVYDLYGPSETTTYSTFTLRQSDLPATIGRPLANEQIYLLDRNRQPVPIGVPGEIYIGGAGVGRGYLNRPELTGEKFVSNPFRSASRLYRTGDLARWRADGNLEFLGRIDHQVKIRGFRIELGEIESVLRKHPALQDLIVVAREDGSDGKRLVAYVTTGPGKKVTADELRRFTREKLPEYMIPLFVFLEALPLTPNGKIDRKALPEPVFDRQSGDKDFVAPQNPEEETLAKIWCEVLNLKQVGIHDNFFELGGHSLLAVRVISRIRETLRAELPLSALFNAPTIAALAVEAKSDRWREQTPAIPLEPVSRTERIPASFIQEQLWFFDQIQPGTPAYNMPIAFRLKGRLDVTAMQNALNGIVSRHEALRTTLHYADGKLSQVISAPQPVILSCYDLRFEPDREKRLQSLLNGEGQRSFDLQSGPLMRVTLIRLDENEHALVVVVHHSIFDGWSWAIFFKELGTLYDALAAGRSLPTLPDLPIQYADFAKWRKKSLQGAELDQALTFWKEKLKNAPPVIDLPTDRDESENLPEKADHRTVVFSGTVTEAMTALGRAEGISTFMTLFTALSITLEKWTQQHDLVLGTVVAGRDQRVLENAIGCFMNFLPIRLQFAGDETGQTLLAKVRATVLDAQAHQSCPFEKIVEFVNPERRPNRNPLYNVALLLQNFPRQMFATETLQTEPLKVEMHAPLVDLRFEALPQGDNLSMVCEYNTGLFDAATIEHLLAAFSRNLETLVLTPATRLVEYPIAEELQAQSRRVQDRKGEATIAIASTFTAEPIEESLAYWTKELEIPARIRFAPFNQVFQQLLDPASLLSTNSRGLNVLLIRPEDWLEDDRNVSISRYGEVEKAAREFISALKSAASRISAPMLVVFCPASTGSRNGVERERLWKKVEHFSAAELEKVSGVHVVTTWELLELYSVADFYDRSGDDLGRVPYTPVFFTALGTMIARKLHALQRTPHKVVVLDCDQTLWAGVCGEDGVHGICLDAPRRALQKFMRAQHDAGRLLAICSKNNEEDVREVFEQRLDMPLRREHITAWRTNWRPKSENLKSIAAELNLGLDSFIFVDDNPMECAEVEANCPEVTVIQLPEEPEKIPQFLKHCWVFDHLKLTAEDHQRGQKYKENHQREQLRAQSMTLADFVGSLDLKIQIEPMTTDQVARVSQLTQRTNQFNCTTLRRSEADLKMLANSAEIFTVTVRDRFGDYGLVGAAICTAHGEMLDVETFLLSCRVLGRGVEHAVLSALGKKALDQNHRWVDVHFHPSPKNKPAVDFLQNVGANFRQPLNGGFIYRFPAEVAATVAFNPSKLEAQSGGDAETKRESAPASLAIQPVSAAKMKITRCRAIALQANDPLKIHQAIEAGAVLRTGKQNDYVPARTEMEQQLCAIWQKLLRIDRVGANDNFFELGGHSLLAVRLFTDIEKLTGRKFPLVTVFQAPTIEKLAEVLSDQDNIQLQSPLVPVQANGSRPPLFLVHGAGGDVLWGYANLAKHMSPDQPIYGIKSRGQVGLEEYDRIEDMARYYLEEIQKLQPQGPYYLGGYCFGGNVAYEMARQLEQQGETVALVALLDASPCNAGYNRMPWWKPSFALRFARNLSYWLQDFEELPREERRRYFSRKARVIGRKLARKLRTSRNRKDVDLEEVIDPNHFPEHELKFWRIHLRAIENHNDQPYGGHVTLIRTRGQPLFCSLEEDFCWSKLAHGGATVKRIPGSHENIFVEPNVRSLASQLDSCLADARTAASEPTPRFDIQMA